tara:strand:+ start:452 stop:1456 length:1005 start_codon:yes stop_codon:yes gene_type:complete
MDNNNFTIFNSKPECYPHIMSEISLNNFLAQNFTPYTQTLNNNMNPIEYCENKALENNKPFFLISDLSNNNNNNDITYKCYIPKVNKICEFSNNNIENLFLPFNRLINDLFGISSNSGLPDQNPRVVTTIDKRNVNQEISFNGIISANNNCFYLNNNNNERNYYFSKNPYFIIYKTNLIDNSNFDNVMTEIKNYKTYYIYEYNKWDASENTILTDLSSTFRDYICDPNTYSENFNTTLNSLRDHYITIFNLLNNISTDISNLSQLTYYDTLYLQQLQEKIDIKKRDLKNLLGFDGANNGKLDDTMFLKNLKISENIILFLVITFIVYMYVKKHI